MNRCAKINTEGAKFIGEAMQCWTQLEHFSLDFIGYNTKKENQVC